MDLAIVTGCGHEKLTNIYQLKPYLQEEHVWCIGNREYDADYVKPILASDINAVSDKYIFSIGHRPARNLFYLVIW